MVWFIGACCAVLSTGNASLPCLALKESARAIFRAIAAVRHFIGPVLAQAEGRQPVSSKALRAPVFLVGARHADTEAFWGKWGEMW